MQECKKTSLQITYQTTKKIILYLGYLINYNITYFILNVKQENIDKNDRKLKKLIK
jgi:hypothetical protein